MLRKRPGIAPTSTTLGFKQEKKTGKRKKKENQMLNLGSFRIEVNNEEPMTKAELQSLLKASEHLEKVRFKSLKVKRI